MASAGRDYSDVIHAARQILFPPGHARRAAAGAPRQLRLSFEPRMAAHPAALRPGSWPTRTGRGPPAPPPPPLPPPPPPPPSLPFLYSLTLLDPPMPARPVTGTASRLAHCGRHLAAVDPGIPSLAQLDRQRHIETHLTAIADGRSSRRGEPISASERRGPRTRRQRAAEQHHRVGLAAGAAAAAGVPL